MAVTARFYVAEVAKYPTQNNGWADPAPRGKVVLRPAMRGEENMVAASTRPWVTRPSSSERNTPGQRKARAPQPSGRVSGSLPATRAADWVSV
jgi:hypothetical protein